MTTAKKPPPPDPLDHQGLVWLVAKSYRGRGADLEDLASCGQIGLIRACRTFDPDRGIQFSTYATKSIRRTIQRALMGELAFVRLPAYLHDLLSTPAKQAQLKPSRAERLEEAKACRRLNKIADHNFDSPLADLLQDHRKAKCRLETAEAAAAAEVLLSQLTEREACVLRLRFGIGHEPQTQREIGKVVGVNKDIVRWIERRALDRLRQTMGVPA